MEAKEQLKELIWKLHHECGVIVEPTYPRILVRIIPKEQITPGGLLLPDWEKHQQNKPAAEAMVLKTYKPIFVPVSKVGRMELDEMGNMAAVKRQFVDDDGKTLGYWLESPLQPGDHVLVPHIEFGIIPVWPLDDGVGHYKMVPEGLISGKVEYEKEKTEDWLYSVFAEQDGIAPNELKAVQLVMKHADVIRKDVVAKTLSGS